MTKIICKLPNATSPINGIPFEAHQDGLISMDHVDEPVAAALLTIPGYVAAADDDADVDTLRAQAAALGVRVKGNWGSERLKNEIKSAENAAQLAAEKAAALAKEQAGDDPTKAGGA